ncbi:uncharacterized protein LOC122329764 [Puntigrus tetrazona]|uniref:uncharacterized protein LOC122329764 n=1 Tax=Puntigrus tetrazona TaxID=1606681 RepID=UPI001C8ACB2C|nr:uncharacterized protein LOC122329764 [Puntigrus tetrazona]
MAEAKEVSVTKKGFSLVCPSDIVYCDPGDDVVLSCHLDPAISAASTEIKWKIRADLVYHYKNGEVIESCEGRVSLSLEDIHNGNVSLNLRGVRRSQRGIYICEVIHENQTAKEYIFLHIRSVDVSLVVPNGPVFADPGEDVILPARLLPETSAVFMEIRWFKGRWFIYEYMNRQRLTNYDYDNRASLPIQQLETGNLSLTLRNVDQSDSGDYTCLVSHAGLVKIGVVHLQVRERQKKKCVDKLEELLDDLTKIQDLPHELRLKTSVLEKRLKLLQEALDNEDEYKRRKKEMTYVLGPTHRRLNSTEGIRPIMGEETHFLEVERESSVQITRQESTDTEQVLSSPDTSRVLQRESTSANTVMQTDQERTRESTAVQQERSSPEVQSAEGSRTRTPRRPEDTAQSGQQKTNKNCQIL